MLLSVNIEWSSIPDLLIVSMIHIIQILFLNHSTFYLIHGIEVCCCILIDLNNPYFQFKDDSVYMKDKFWREEYILNDQGIIWRGTHDQMKSTHWNFAQFEENILEACLYALANIGKLKPADR